MMPSRRQLIGFDSRPPVLEADPKPAHFVTGLRYASEFC